MDAFFSSVLGKMSKTFGRFDDIDDDGTMKMTDDPATAMAQRPDELFERMKPPSSRRGVSGDDDDDDDDDEYTRSVQTYTLQHPLSLSLYI